jgi:hypothetical protein
MRFTRLQTVLVFTVALIPTTEALAQAGETVSLQARRTTLNSSSRDGRERASFDFTAEEHGPVAHGAFYYYTGRPETPVTKYGANNLGQRGLVDLGALTFDPTNIDIPGQGYSRQAIAAIPSHVYVALPKEGEDNRYIIFKTRSTQDTESLIEYYVVDIGTIIVNTNHDRAGFRLVGPRHLVGLGKAWQRDRMLVGEYTLVYDTIPGFLTPTSEKQELTRGGVVVFEASYTPDSTAGGVGPGPSDPATAAERQPTATEPSRWYTSTEVIVALIGMVTLVVVALIGLKKKS